MREFKLKIITPDGPFFSGNIYSLLARCSSGDVCILAGHTDYLTPIDFGSVKIKDKNGEKYAAVMGGFLTVTNGEATIIATTAEFAENIDVQRAERAKKRAEKIIQNKENDKDIALAELKLKRALNRLGVSKKV